MIMAKLNKNDVTKNVYQKNEEMYRCTKDDVGESHVREE